ncbi:MAG TPA: primosomal protein N', partial [Dehalococcoidales bacterium]|nr:primosomal protein N' [Dehalococcoidales bacterium]
MYAEVSVNSPAAQRRTFSYSIPPQLDVKPGQAVWVPFGQQLAQGIVIRLTDSPGVEQVKDIAGVIDPQPLLTLKQIELARWISDYYLSSLFDAIALMLPPGFERRVITSFAPVAKNCDTAKLTEVQIHILNRVQHEGVVGLKDLEKTLGKKKAQANTTSLVKKGLIARRYELEREKVKARAKPHVRLSINTEDASIALQKLSGSRFAGQAAIVEYLLSRPGYVSLIELKKTVGCDRSTVNTLVKKGLVEMADIVVRREPAELQQVQLSQPLQLTPQQTYVFQSVCTSLKGMGAGKNGDVFLLHGVTGSGKTEIYLQALAETVKLGKRGIVLVPEISLTPQTIERFTSRFPGRVAVIHSQLHLGEQFDEWQKIKNGEVDVVIGTRSALFAPQPDLGLIVIDEEHEWTYKQHEQSPRYHARDVALKMNQLSGCVVLLGSATPAVETYYAAQTLKKIRLLRMPHRVTPVNNTPLPPVTIVDMRNELKEDNRSIFSRELASSINSVLANEQQAILFLNRRGASTYVQCRNCGFVVRCKRCDIPLTYHTDTQNLMCHQCNTHYAVPVTCPRCSSRRIKYLGLGTEKLEQEVQSTFPKARLLRWDRDVTRGRNSHQKILARFRAHEADILIGTQMVAKGLDLPLVTLVGVVNGDLSLHIPDFRAGERTFTLLSQVAGRAGRGSAGGRVIVQTYNPEHYAIQAAATHNYEEFFNREIAYRWQLKEPPFVQLVNLIFLHTNENKCKE